MKKLILIALVSLLSVSSAFAESAMSKLQYVETKSCSNAELIRTIKETANRVLFDDVQLTALEEGLQITQEQKKQGIVASIEGAHPRSNVTKHEKSVARAEADAKAGRVGVTVPAKFDVVFNVKDASGKTTLRGRLMLDVACRIEAGKEALRHTAQLLAFDIQAKKK